MSFDKVVRDNYGERIASQSLSSRAMSFDDTLLRDVQKAFRLNPFRAGRCLSTIVALPHELFHVSQSLSSRAMSFDTELPKGVTFKMSQSLSSRAMSFDKKCERN